MKATGLTNVVPRHTFVSFNQYGCPKIEPKSFGARFVKRPQTRLGSAFKADLDTLNSKTFTDKSPHQGEGSSVPLKYTVAIYTGMSKKNSGYDTVTLEKYIFICSCIYYFLFFFPINNEYIHKSLCQLLLFHLLFREL